MDSALKQTAEGSTLSQSKTKKYMKWASWAALTLWLLCFFTLVKLPEAKLTNLIQGHLANALAPYGITVRPEETSLSIFFGLKYKMKKVRLYLPSPAKEALIDEIQLSPSLSSLLLGKLGVDLYLRKDKGDLSATLAMRGKKKVFVDYNVDQLDLSKLEIMQTLAGFSLNALLKGKGSFSAEMTGPGGSLNGSSFSGSLNLQIKNLLIEAQTLLLGGAPFPIPQINLSEANFDFSANNGKMKIKTFKIGRSDKATDDLVTNITGDLTMTADSSNTVLNLQIPQLKASEPLRKKLLLDFALSRFKQSDGSYSGITLNGPASGLHIPL